MARLIRLFLKFLQNPISFFNKYILPKIKNNSLVKRHKKTSVLQNQFISKLSRYKIKWDKTKKGVVLTQIVSDYEMCIKLAIASHKIACNKNANIGAYSVEYFQASKNPLINYLLSYKVNSNLDKIFLSFAGKVLYRNSTLYKDQTKIRSLLHKIKQELKTKEDVLELHLEGIKIGDLFYDAYLRYANKPELNINDPFIDNLLFQMLNIYFVTKQKIKEHKVIALVSSYTSYIYHGIAVRLCLNLNIPVYTISGYSLVHKVMKDYPSHANNHFLFKKIFQKIPNKEAILQQYKPIFEKRFEGVIDSATYYMKQSAFSSETNPELVGLDWDNSVVVLAHCFFDSPHVYRDLLFPDLYDWITFTLDELIKQTNLTILVKQHPNGLPQNDLIFEQLKIKYKNYNVKFIDKKTSQLQIINSRPKAIVTAYGTAAAEFSYQGFPVLTIYDNPFTAYDFTHLAKTQDEYRDLLKNIISLPPKQNQQEVIEYYYMQYIFFLKGRSIDYLNCAKYKGQTFSDDFLEDYLPNMTSNYFEDLDKVVIDGFELCDWEEKNH